MKSIIALIIIIAFFGCTKKKDIKEFESIDYSYFAGYFRSVKIFNNGKTYVFYRYKYPEREKYYSLDLQKKQLDSISSMVRNLCSNTTDTVYETADIDSRGQTSALIIKLGKRKSLKSNETNIRPRKESNYIISLEKYLDKISYEARKNSDSLFVFKSVKKLILPPPPPEK